MSARSRKLGIAVCAAEATVYTATAPKWVPWLVRACIGLYLQFRGWNPNVGLGG